MIIGPAYQAHQKLAQKYSLTNQNYFIIPYNNIKVAHLILLLPLLSKPNKIANGI